MKKITGIQIFTNITKDFIKTGFDGFELHPCKVINGVDSILAEHEYIEQCEPNEAEFWSVYVHLVGAGLDCIADCENEQQAKNLIAFLEGLIRNFKNG